MHLPESAACRPEREPARAPVRSGSLSAGVRHTRLETVVEIACVVIVLAALVALVVWILIHHGGGVLYQG